jgi:hypothetical protein
MMPRSLRKKQWAMDARSTRKMVRRRAGRHDRWWPVTPWFGDVYEVIVFDRVLSDEEQAALTAYIWERYVPAVAPRHMRMEVGSV